MDVQDASNPALFVWVTKGDSNGEEKPCTQVDIFFRSAIADLDSMEQKHNWMQ